MPARLARRLLAVWHMRLAPIIRRPWLASLCGALALAPLAHAADLAPAAAPVVATPSPYEDIAHLESLARSTALQEFAPLSDHQRLLVGPLEPRLELAKCQAPVRSFLSSAHHMKDRATIELRCEDAKPWHFYVPVRVLGTSQVAVAAHAIVVGSVLKAEDLRVEEHDISDLPLGFMDDPAVAVGLTVARPIAGGAYITNQQLLAAKAVQRGQTVTLVADTGGLSIRMAGRALSDGLVNQRVKVTNLSSGKVVEGIARSEQVVEIILQ
jgi:flagella basal body P-ring formation protein FlgA